MDTFWCYRVVFINIKRMYIVQINSSTTMDTTSNGHIQNHRSHKPSRSHWTSNIETSKQLFHDTTLRKVVLARESYFTPKDPWIQFIELQRSQPNNYHFLFSPKPNTIFLGASPEKLF